MQIREFDTEKDYSDICTWWARHSWPQIPKDMLSSKGFLIEDGDQKIACVWFFQIDCPISIMEWMVVNPDVHWEKRSEAQHLLIQFVLNYAKDIAGSKYIFTMAKHPRLMKRLEENGFMETDNSMTHFIRSL